MRSRSAGAPPLTLAVCRETQAEGYNREGRAQHHARTVGLGEHLQWIFGDPCPLLPLGSERAVTQVPFPHTHHSPGLETAPERALQILLVGSTPRKWLDPQLATL